MATPDRSVVYIRSPTSLDSIEMQSELYLMHDAHINACALTSDSIITASGMNDGH